MIRIAALALVLVTLGPGQETRPDPLATLLFLEDSRSPEVAAWRALLERADAPAFRARVIRGLGRVAEPALKPLLVEVLDGSGPWTRDVQRAAALAVGLFGDPDLLPKFAAKTTPRDVFFALGLLRKLPAQGRERLLAWEEPERAPESAPGAEAAILRDPVESALRSCATVEEPAFADLAGRTLRATDAPAHRKLAAVDYFARSKAKAPADLRSTLAGLLRSDDPELAGLAARALAKSEGAGEDEVKAIEAAFLGSTAAVARADAARALAAVPTDVSFAALIRMLASTGSDPAGRRTVLESLRTVAEKLPAEVRKPSAAAVAAILDPDERRLPAPPDVQAAAISLLAAVDPVRFKARLPEFRFAAPWQVRAAVASGFVLLDGDAQAVQVESFARMLADPDRRVRAATLEAIAARAKDVRRVVARSARHVRTSDPVELAAIASLHLAVEGSEAETFVAKAASEIPHHEVEALQSLLDLAGALKSDAGNEILRGYLGSPEISLRKRAKALLEKNGIDAPESRPRTREWPSARRAEDARKHPQPSAVIETSRGNVTIALFRSDCPATVESFLNLAKQGFYDGILWHRVVPAFVAQAGCPRGDGWGGPGYTIRCEVNDRTYRRGSVGMALAGKDTGGSQFFICHRALPHLDGRYTLFGEVTEGMDVVDRLGQEDYIIRVREQ